MQKAAFVLSLMYPLSHNYTDYVISSRMRDVNWKIVNLDMEKED